MAYWLDLAELKYGHILATAVTVISVGFTSRLLASFRSTKLLSGISVSVPDKCSHHKLLKAHYLTLTSVSFVRNILVSSNSPCLRDDIHKYCRRY